MHTARVYIEDVELNAPVRAMHQYIDQMQLVEWCAVTAKDDAGHWHNRWEETSDPNVSEKTGFDPSMTGQMKTALREKMLLEWAGPYAWVKTMKVQYRVWDHFLELKRFSGTVTGKRTEGDLSLEDVTLELARENGKPTTQGTATLVLTTRH